MLARTPLAAAFLLVATVPARAEVDPACINGPTATEGIAACTEAIERPEPDAELLSLAYSNRAAWLWETGEFEAARADATEAIAIDPENWRAHLNRARALDDLGRLDQALADYDRALALDVDEPEDRAFILIDRGNALYEAGEYAAALPDYEASLELVKDPVIYQNIGLTLYRLRDFEAAIAAHEKALALDPEHLPSITNRGEALEELGDYEGAMAAYDRAMSLDFDGWAHATMAYMAERGYWDGPLDGPDSVEFRMALEACVRAPDC